MRSVPLGANLGSPALLYIAQETSLTVGYNVRVLVGLYDSNVTRITCREFLVGLDILSSCGLPWDYIPQAPEHYMLILEAFLFL